MNWAGLLLNAFLAIFFMYMSARNICKCSEEKKEHEKRRELIKMHSKNLPELQYILLMQEDYSYHICIMTLKTDFLFLLTAAGLYLQMFNFFCDYLM